MSDLPKMYMRVARDLTGYWGTYLPSRRLEPGIIGSIVEGVFVPEGRLDQLLGYDKFKHGVQQEPEGDPASAWATQHVTFTDVNVSGTAPAGLASAGIRMRFGAANEALIICSGVSYRSFSNLRNVKELMKQLFEAKQWDREQCVITEVVASKAAWICFSTAKDQALELDGSAPLLPGADPLGLLKNAAGNLSLKVASTDSLQAAYSTTVPDGGTPLFRALRFRRGLLHPFHSEPQYLKGGDDAFEEPEFGA